MESTYLFFRSQRWFHQAVKVVTTYVGSYWRTPYQKRSHSSSAQEGQGCREIERERNWSRERERRNLFTCEKMVAPDISAAPELALLLLTWSAEDVGVSSVQQIETSSLPFCLSLKLYGCALHIQSEVSKWAPQSALHTNWEAVFSSCQACSVLAGSEFKGLRGLAGKRYSSVGLTQSLFCYDLVSQGSEILQAWWAHFSPGEVHSLGLLSSYFTAESRERSGTFCGVSGTVPQPPGIFSGNWLTIRVHLLLLWF